MPAENPPAAPTGAAEAPKPNAVQKVADNTLKAILSVLSNTTGTVWNTAIGQPTHDLGVALNIQSEANGINKVDEFGQKVGNSLGKVASTPLRIVGNTIVGTGKVAHVGIKSIFAAPFRLFSGAWRTVRDAGYRLFGKEPPEGPTNVDPTFGPPTAAAA